MTVTSTTKLNAGPALEAYRESRPARGLSWKDLYITPGNRTYLIGSQNGGFPDFGHHVKLEMGGLWLHPIKLLDGFWLHAADSGEAAGAPGEWLTEADSFHNYPFFNEHRYALPGLGLEAVRRQFCPDDAEGLVVSYTLRDTSGRDRELDLRFLARTDLSPVWFSEGKGIEDGFDEGRLSPEEGLFLARDAANPWHVAVGADRPFASGAVGRELFGPHWTAGKGVSGELRYERVAVPAGGESEIRLFVAGSYRSEEEAKQTFRRLANDHVRLWDEKCRRYEGIAAQTVLTIPDKRLQRVFDWVKFHNDWFVRDVPEIGRGMGAGHPEYPWWFGCDNSYALLGLLPVGGLSMAQETLALLRKASDEANGNGRIIHELSTSGLVANPGNTQETAHFIQCVWEVFLWTGDTAFLRDMYPGVKRGLAWLLEEMDPDGDLLPEGYGIIEIEGLNVELIDSAVYTWSALNAGSRMAEVLGEPRGAAAYADLAERLGAKINGDLWLEDEGLYADAMASVGKVASRIDTYIERARSMGAEHAVRDMEAMKAELSALDPELERAWLFKNWVINTPMETGLAPRDKALRALDRMGTDEFTGPWGTYLSGMYRDQMMTISTGVQAVAEARYDRMDESLGFVKLIASTFGLRLPGSISEMSPDYGCFVQAWTVYGIVWPMLTRMLGIQPSAHERTLTLRPRLPRAWDDAAVEQVELGLGEAANRLALAVSRADGAETIRFALDRPGWSVALDLADAADAEVTLDGEAVAPAAVRDDGSALYRIADAGRHEVRVRRMP
ncbi:glycogen debranching protein [Paenibacillus sp. MWE-103]|uniref:Glycogen debranching protein n=1 Tax=Paenibacillus artemisiicola TaxID=1172618 RepID=A0ABS3WK55_9BACL|nr:glycogen debranching protein [Paenibacillus artemisiicola]MBO7748696.1 glycogen debranching protein [Paenibacillus artemisiicola]